eukprot:6214078-Pleurochrysis_carterae.AAC.2
MASAPPSDGGAHQQRARAWSGVACAPRVGRLFRRHRPWLVSPRASPRTVAVPDHGHPGDQDPQDLEPQEHCTAEGDCHLKR